MRYGTGRWWRSIVDSARALRTAGATARQRHDVTPSRSGASSRPLRVLLLGDFGGGNLGNEASLEAAVAELRRRHADVRIRVACSEPELLERQRRLPAITWRPKGRGLHRIPWESARAIADLAGEPLRWFRALAIVRSADAVLVPGTGILDDFGVRPWEQPLTLLTWSSAARTARRPFTFCAVGAGPITNPWSRRLLVSAARLASRVSYRDAGSREFMRRCGRDTGADQVCPDLAFATPHEVPPQHVDGGGIRAVGLGVMSYGGWSGRIEGQQYQEYLTLLDDIIDGISARGRRIVFLIGQPNDRLAVEALTERAIRRGIPSDMLAGPPIDTFPDLLDVIGTTDYVIATRYHNVVGAMIMARPVISVGYAPKNAQLFEQIGLTPVDQHVDNASAQWVLNAMDEHEAKADFVAACRSSTVRDGWRDGIQREFADVLATITKSA